MHGKSFQERFRSKPEHVPPKTTSASKRMPRSQERFVRITASQAERLFELEPICWPLFTILQFENFRHHGRAFVLPTDKLATIRGLSRSNLHRSLLRLEACSLISVRRNPPKPPQITVP